ncbi:hypothetical protein C8J57DRAFT_1117049, partial [Mycena rebaudengoi]
MPKLHLKRTPQEEADHRRRKKRKRESTRRAEVSPDRDDTRNKPSRKWDSSDSDGDDEVYGPHPPQPEAGSSKRPPPEPSDTRYKPDYEAIRAELEEARFREKMAGAFDDDERLDSLEAHMNQFAHIPGRWRGHPNAEYDAADDDDISKLDPRQMDDEEYAEWIRAGMYKKTHAQEYAEKQHKKALRDARRAHEKALKAETARLAKLAEDDRKRRRLEKDIRRSDYAREEYHLRWKALLTTSLDDDQSTLTFSDIPWPIAAAHHQKADKKADKKGSQGTRPPPLVSLAELTADAISAFLVPATVDSLGDKEKKDRKDKLRETILRFHPDKFEGRLMKRVRERDQENVREAIGVVVRTLNALMGEG